MPPRKKPADIVAADIPDVPSSAAQRWVIYTIVVPNCADNVAIERARRSLNELKVPAHLIYISGTTVSVPRLMTIWQGDQAEQTWQQSIKAALTGALIDVADWTHAIGYPQGDIGEVKNGK